VTLSQESDRLPTGVHSSSEERPIRNCSRVEGDTRTDGIEPRSDFLRALVDPTEARNALVLVAA